jgi:hypothetical protein
VVFGVRCDLWTDDILIHDNLTEQFVLVAELVTPSRAGFAQIFPHVYFHLWLALAVIICPYTGICLLNLRSFIPTFSHEVFGAGLTLAPLLILEYVLTTDIISCMLSSM